MPARNTATSKADSFQLEPKGGRDTAPQRKRDTAPESLPTTPVVAASPDPDPVAGEVPPTTASTGPATATGEASPTTSPSPSTAGSGPVPTSTAASFDPFDPAGLRLSQDFAAGAGVEKLLTRVPIRKPTKQEFVRVRSEPEYCLETAMIELKEDREFYLLTPQVAAALPGEWTLYRLYTAVSTRGVLFLWPCRLPDQERPNPWHETLLEAADLAKTEWVRVRADMDLGAYEIGKAVGDLPPPAWTGDSLGELLKIGFGKRLVQGIDHPLVDRLLGRA